jgi:cytochrome c556
LWEAIAPKDQRKMVRRLRAIHTPMVRHLQKLNKKAAAKADAAAPKPSIADGMPDFGDDAALMKAIGQNFTDPAAMVKIEKPLQAYDAELEMRTDQLSQIVERIRKAYDAAKINNTKAQKLLEEETLSQRSAMAATVVLGEQQKVTAGIRTDKSANFPTLPKEAYSVKA